MSRPRTTTDPDDDDLFDDLPTTHLDDEDYEAFLDRELDGAGRPKGAPAVGWIIVVLVVILLAVAVVAFR